MFSADTRQLEMVKRQLDLLGSLVGDLHTLSLARAGQLALEQRDFVLATLVDERLAWFAPQLQAEGVTVRLALLPAQPLRADSSRALHLGGSGLGLSIARAICEAHQGRIEAQCRAGGGAVIRIELLARPQAG